MAGPFISVKVEGEKQLAAGFLRVEKNIKNFRLPLTEANILMRKSIDLNFIKEGSELGKPWQPLANPTGGKILQDTGRMRNSFSSIITNTRVVISNSVPYFKFHQSARLPRQQLPRRIMMRIDAERRNEIIRIFTKFLHRVAKGF